MYTTKNGVSHLFDTYADDLTIYLQRHSYNEKKNLENISKALEIIEMFFIWSGLKVNRGKTYLSIFGESLEKPRFVKALGIKWCTEFTLLRIKFDQTLDLMDSNFDSCFKKVKNELSSLKHRYLTVFGKITV